MKIKKGDRFLCIKDFIMDDGEISYTKDKEYLSEIDRCITDNTYDTRHLMEDSGVTLKNYFKKVD